MKILLIGNGAREHAIFNALSRSKHRPEIIVFGKSKNPGMLSRASVYEVGNYEDMDLVKQMAQKHSPDLAIIGPDNPIGSGAAEPFHELGIPVFAPRKTVARLESSKSFTRDLLQKYKVPGNPTFRNFTKENISELPAFLAELGDDFVIKYDGLLGGKGVKVSGEHLQSHEEGIAFANECLESSDQVVVEEKLVGPEFSLMFFADGNSIAAMPAIQDHKRAYNGDTGPNTGGMGTYSDANFMLPFIDLEDLAQAHDITMKTMKALKSETGTDFVGIMYGGFMKTKNGTRLIEYNARFGDPEAMNALPILKTDFVDLCLSATKGELSDLQIEFERLATVCIYVVPEGYPDTPMTNEDDKIIRVSKSKSNAELFFASVDLIEETDSEYILKMSSSRALAFVGKGKSIDEALKNARSGLSLVSGKIFYRDDIATPELIQTRIDLVNSFE